MMLSRTSPSLKDVCLDLMRRFSRKFAMKAPGYFLFFWFILSFVDKKQTNLCLKTSWWGRVGILEPYKPPRFLQTRTYVAMYVTMTSLFSHGLAFFPCVSCSFHCIWFFALLWMSPCAMSTPWVSLHGGHAIRL